MANYPFEKQLAQITQVITDELPYYVLHKSEDVINESFEKEQYQGKENSNNWPERKRDDRSRNDKNNARNERRGLLIKSGDLRRSIQVNVNGMDVHITSDVPYSSVHNEGLKSGRGKGFIMPKRQFMPIPGERFVIIDEAIEDFIEDRLRNIK
jgi:phage gpG-like protein